MSNLNIRLAEPRDDALVGELLVRAFETAYAKKMPEVRYTEERRRELRDLPTKRAEGTVFVAELGEEIVGTVTLFRPGAPKSEAWLPNAADLRHLAVAPEHFGKRYSDALLDVAEMTAFGWGVDGICLHVRRGAHGVARTYERRGYVRDPSGDMDLPTLFLEAYVLRKR